MNQSSYLDGFAVSARLAARAAELMPAGSRIYKDVSTAFLVGVAGAAKHFSPEYYLGVRDGIACGFGF